MASYLPPETYRLLEWRQRSYRTSGWGVISGVELAHSGVVAEIRELIADRGPMTASEVHELYAVDHPRTRTEWGWNWTVAKRALEFLFFTGEVTSACRTAAFERCYDLTERVLPPAVLAARRPRRATTRTLLSPFDPLVFERRRLEEIFGMHYRIEIYVPAAQRVYGYYVLPFLLGERLAARVDLKADRRAGVLRVLAAHREDGAPGETPAELAVELREMATWLGLAEIEVARPHRGDLAATLAGALAVAGDGAGDGAPPA